MRIFLFSFLLLFSACTSTPDKDESLILKPVSYEELPGWNKDNFKTVLPALQRSCERIIKRDTVQAFGSLEQAGTYKDWQPICYELLSITDMLKLRPFIEEYFQPYKVYAGTKEEGLFTGYYEASLKGARTKYGAYRYPIHARPDDLVMVALGDFRDELKGQRIAGRVINGKLKPYEDRADIVSGNWPHNDKALLWIDNPVDAFFVQIQGSGVIEVEETNAQKSLMRIGYAGQNGHIYYAIGRELVKRGYLTKDNVSMQSIREWLEQNPDEADEIMNTNRSYVFFEESEKDGAVGGEGVVLTAGRSLAVDHLKIPYGTPLWVDINPPLEGEQGLQRLMVAQDTGGAIRGAVRGDVYWGHGERAEYLAGHMKSKGRYWLLLPRFIEKIID
ncbi:MAG: murein transglycosylase A [Alphaproteobacteria bacterium]|nr:murein transglycosylase A [Alphaproteobacteria bacterium]